MSSIVNFLALHSKKQEQPIFVPEKKFTFGKYKGKTYDEVFELDKSYVCFCMEGDPKYYRRIQDYYKNLIESSV